MTISREDVDAGRVDFSDLEEAGGERLPPSHPGEHLADWMEEEGISAKALGRALNVPHNRVFDIVKGRRSVTAETAMRLGRHLGTSAEFWLNLQKRYDLEIARRERGEAVANEVMPRVHDMEPA